MHSQIDITTIPENDTDVWKMIGEGRVKGCFQIESHLGKTWCQKLKPENITELAALISIIRPGCISGDTYITVKKYLHKDKKNSYKRIKIRDLHDKKITSIYSLDESNLSARENTVLDIFYSGQKECFSVKIRKYSMSQTNNKDGHPAWYDLECTDDHKLFTSNLEWVALKDLKIGDRIAVFKKQNNRDIRNGTISNRHVKNGPRHINVSGTRYFHEICYKNYIEKCVMCGWCETTLDVHHISGNRHTDNSKNNLVFLCPNCHRKEIKHLITNDQIIANRLQYALPESNDIEWVTYIGKESVGIKDTYDISMTEPHNSFIAGNFVVHNCLKATHNGKSMTQHFVDRKHGKEEIPSLHPLIDDILKETYGVIVYQEQAMEISVKMAGFNLKEADDLRKAIGKKKADLMKEVRVKFIDGCNKNAIDEDKSIEIFDMIEKSARYSFNKSHGVAYAKMAYWSAWVKYHYPEKFFKNWLRNADEKIDPDFEKRQLIMSAKSENITVRGPSIKVLEENFSWQDGCIYFGICNVKNVGKGHLAELKKHLDNLAENEQTWTHIMVKVLPHVNKRAVENLIQTGAFSGFGKSRSEMLHEFHCYLDLTKKEIEAIKENINSQDATVAQVIERFMGYGLKKNGGFISTQSRLDKVQSILLRINNPGRSLVDNSVTYAKIEEKLLGCSINHSELSSCSDAAHANTTCKEISEGKSNDLIVAVVIKKIREHKTKNGDLMAFMSVEDDSAELENVVVFPDIYEQNKDIMYEQATVLISGKIQDKKRNSFIVDKVFLI